MEEYGTQKETFDKPDEAGGHHARRLPKKNDTWRNKHTDRGVTPRKKEKTA